MSETADLLERVRSFFSNYVVLPGDHFHDAVSLWILHSHAIRAAETTPRLVFKSPEKESGKTRSLEVIETLVPQARFTINSTTAAIFRRLKEEQLTLLLDECDAIFNPKAGNHEDLRALLNSGHRRGATIDRIVGEGKKMKAEAFPVFAAVAMAAIGDLPDTIESRAIRIPMRRRAPDEPVQPFRYRKAKPVGDALREELARWAQQHGEHLTQAEPAMPDGVTDRAADIWEPLVAIADLAGGDWPDRARAAAEAIVAGRVAEDQSIGVRLLADIKMVISGQDRMSSASMAKALNLMAEAAWGGFHSGTGIDQRGLAKYLKPYGIKTRDIRLPDGTVPKGYLRSDFADAWARYLREGSATSATSATPIRIDVADVADVALGGDGGGEQTLDLSDGAEVADVEVVKAVAPILDRFGGKVVAVVDAVPAAGSQRSAIRRMVQPKCPGCGWIVVLEQPNGSRHCFQCDSDFVVA